MRIGLGRALHCSRSVAASIWVTLLVPGCTAIPRDLSHDPPGFRWTPPEPLTPQLEATARYPDLTLTESGTYVSDFTIRDPAAAGTRAGTGLRIRTPDQQWTEAPPGEFTFAYPHIVLTARSRTLHLLWAEPPPLPPDSLADAVAHHQFASVWHAALQVDGWSAPERVYAGTRVFWDPVQISQLVSDQGDVLHVVFPVIDSASAPGLMHLRLEGSRWSRNSIAVHGPPVYVDLSAGKGGDVAIAYAAYHRDSAGYHTNTLFVMRSEDDGRTWTEPYRATQPAQGPAYEPRLARQGDTLHLLWTQSAAADVNQTVALWHAASSDGGTSWSLPERYPLSGMTHQLQAVADSCGGVHVVISDFSRLRLMHARLGGSAATGMQTPFAGTGGNPVLRMDADGTLHLVWADTRLRGPDDTAGETRLLHSTLETCAGVFR